MTSLVLVSIGISMACNVVLLFVIIVTARDRRPIESHITVRGLDNGDSNIAAWAEQINDFVDSVNNRLDELETTSGELDVRVTDLEPRTFSAGRRRLPK